MRKWQLIVFDLDDTLYPERDFVFSGFKAVSKWAQVHLGIPSEQSFKELCHLFHSHVRCNTFDNWLVSHGLEPADWVLQLVEIYRQHEPSIAPYPGVRELLQDLSQRYRLGLVSDGYAAVQRRKLQALALTSLFDAIILSDELGRDFWKPSNRPFELLLESLGVCGSDAVYIGDNPIKDFVGARQAGMATVRVRTALGLHSHSASISVRHAPDEEIKDLSELEDCLRRIAEAVTSKGVAAPPPGLGA